MAENLLASNPMFGVYDKGFYIFTLDIRFYAIAIMSGMVLAAALSSLLMKRRNMAPDFIFLLFVVCIPSAVVGARLFSCLTDGSLSYMKFGAWLKDMIVPPWQGLSITGGVIFGVGAGFVVCLIKKVDFLRAADCVVPTILIAQAIGRWGNYFNGEVYGSLITDPAQQWFPWAVEVGGKYYHAFFFYEMVLNLIGFALLFTFTWYRKRKPNGISMFLYFVWYGTVRTIMEPLRNSAFILDGGGVMWSELFAILMIGFGICGSMILMIKNFLREGAFLGSRKGDPCGITEYLSADRDEKPYYSKINMMGANYPERPPKEKKGGGEEDT